MGRGMFGPYTTSTVAAVQRNELKVEATGTYDDAVRALLLSKLSQLRGVLLEEVKEHEVATAHRQANYASNVRRHAAQKAS